jgi:UDPglucose 6-dehydrogenase
MNITIIGTGYVGLVTGVCLAELGHTVICIDNDELKIKALSKGICQIYEPNLNNLLHKNIINKKLTFTSDKTLLGKSSIIIIAVGTPLKENDEINMAFINDVLRDIISNVNNDTIIIIKSTVPIGTADKIKKNLYNTDLNYHIVSNPEFLREGLAIKDFMTPDRIIIGTDSEYAKKVISKLYTYFNTLKVPIIYTDNKTAELIKYASNIYLATRISFINQIADISEVLECNIKDIVYGMGFDKRIGHSYLNPGPGFGGSCLPKDTKALLNTANAENIECPIIKSVYNYNNSRMKKLGIKILDILAKHNVSSTRYTIGILGVTFKADTDDVRNSPSICILKHLIDSIRYDYKIKIFDPQGLENVKKHFKDEKIEYYEDVYEAITECNIIIILTEWTYFKKLDYDKIKTVMKNPIIYDCKNILPKKHMTNIGFDYYGIG